VEGAESGMDGHSITPSSGVSFRFGLPGHLFSPTEGLPAIEEGHGGGDEAGEQYSSEILGKIEAFISSNQPIHMVMAAFPWKSAAVYDPLTKKGKTLGIGPDLAERTSLSYLRDLCRALKSVYEPGARLTIYSDGGINSESLESLGYSDAARFRYVEELRRMVEQINAADMIEIKDTDGEVKKSVEGMMVDETFMKEKIKDDPDKEILHKGSILRNSNYKDGWGVIKKFPLTRRRTVNYLIFSQI
jgi:pyoverdine/dityrosine biosynthesis protein Dit1